MSEPFTMSEAERKEVLNRNRRTASFTISEVERREVLNKKTPVRSRVRINNTGSGRWTIKVDGKTIILAKDHMEASVMKRALQSYLGVLDANS